MSQSRAGMFAVMGLCAFGVVMTTVQTGRAETEPTIAERQAQTTALQDGAYVIGLREIMGAIQICHDNLWFAGTNSN